MSDYLSHRKLLFQALEKEPPPIHEKKAFTSRHKDTEQNIIHYRHYLLNELVRQQIKITPEEVEKVKAFMNTEQGKDGYQRFLKSYLATELIKKNKKAQNLFVGIEKILKDRAKS